MVVRCRPDSPQEKGFNSLAAAIEASPSLTRVRHFKSYIYMQAILTTVRMLRPERWLMGNVWFARGNSAKPFASLLLSGLQFVQLEFG